MAVFRGACVDMRLSNFKTVLTTELPSVSYPGVVKSQLHITGIWENMLIPRQQEAALILRVIIISRCGNDE